MPDIQIPAGQLNLKGPQSPTGVVRWQSSVQSLAFTGLALTLAIAISVPAGAVAFQGLATSGKEIPLAAGHVALTGLAPTVTATSGTVIANGAGALQYQGLALTVRVGDLALEIPAGQLVFKGPARPAAVFQIPQAAITVTGYAANVAVDSPGSAVSIPAGVVAFTGHALTADPDKGIAIPAGTLALSGQYVSVAFKGLGAGSLVWQGLAPTIGTGSPGGAVAIAIPKGTLTTTGLAPSNVFAFSIALPAGQLVLRGLEPNAGTSESLVIPTGAQAFTGHAPTIEWSTGLGVGAITLTGLTPLLELATAEPGLPVGALVFQGYALQVVHSNGTVIASTVRIARSLTHGSSITRTLTSEVTR